MTGTKESRAAGVALAAIAGAAIGLRPALADPPTTVPLRIATFNTLLGVGAPGSGVLADMGAFMTVLDADGAGPNTGLLPDVVCLQECAVSAPGDVTNFRNLYLPGYQIFSYPGDCCEYNATLVRPDITVLSNVNVATAGPRDIGKVKLQVPAALKPLFVYNAHFKCCGDSTSMSTRANEAATAGNNVNFELNFGGGVNVVFVGDLNSNNNADGTITKLFYLNANVNTPTGILNLPVETLAGRASGSTIITTFPGSGSRLDYICLDTQLAAYFDADSSGTYSQAELNTMGFAYYSNEDAGHMSSGNAIATNNGTSDHRPVVFDVLLPRDPSAPVYDAKDVNHDGVVNLEDLQLWENKFAGGVAPDVDGNRNVDLADRAGIKTFVRGNEAADVTATP